MDVVVDIAFLIARMLFAVVFVVSGIFHFAHRAAMTAYARAVRAPAPDIAVPVTGAAIIAGGLSVASGLYADLGALVLAAFLFGTAFLFHAFWKQQDAQARQTELVHFMKDLALAGAALVVFYAYNRLQGDAGLSLTDPLFGRAE